VRPSDRSGHAVLEPERLWVANGGMVFLDPDGRGVVFAPWIYGREPDPVDRTPPPA
jgi:hypothetical protein